ncbi:LytTR family transcriptional regulator [Pseudoalteromonas sp. C2R02]|uniref:LytTR family DNA-binding domain-containing protein n=1 Tax=Pseudoalteromonas sp. C2R02 TaxID=2841565 RepID=UPI001C08C3A0|nr:LytTR family DNA-binding domain-containing protein [Pseudoalteromonas sp. C2R02]MBU2972058.1 LytTR family transcriptional regulator [Pseudoalteromonas sp. C2R02]
MNGQFPLGHINPFKYFFGLACLFAVLFTFMIKSEHTNVVLHFLQWLLQTNLAMGFLIVMHLLLSRFKLPLKGWKKIILSGLLATIIFSPISLLIDVYIENDTVFTMRELLTEWGNMAPPVIICWLAINMPWLLGFNFNYANKKVTQQDIQATEVLIDSDDLVSQQKLSQKTEQQQTKKINPELNLQQSIKLEDEFTQLVDKIGAENIVFLKSELHYLTIGSLNEEQLILYTLKNAVAILEEHYGLAQLGQVHRSYWVNRNHIKSLQQSGREGSIAVTGDYQVMVSRTHLKKVKSWFEEQLKPC